MSSRRAHSTSPYMELVRKKRRKPLQRKEQRRMLLESLESRELMAIGPQLIGIQPNNDALLRFDRTDVRNVSPQELIFKFDENQRFSAADLSNPGRIQVTRSNKDGDFTPASAISDLGTNGAVQIKFTALRLGQDQNGITINLTKSNHGAPGAP
jgi:large repetitive protein